MTLIDPSSLTLTLFLGVLSSTGFVLDIFVIGILPFISPAASDAQRADKFPWALGGYKGFPKVANLGPTHRRFIAENAAYALLRIAPAFFTTNMPVLLMCVISYMIEGLTIAWEFTSFGAPPNAMVPGALRIHRGPCSRSPGEYLARPWVTLRGLQQ